MINLNYPHLRKSAVFNHLVSVTRRTNTLLCPQLSLVSFPLPRFWLAEAAGQRDTLKNGQRLPRHAEHNAYFVSVSLGLFELLQRVSNTVQLMFTVSLIHFKQIFQRVTEPKWLKTADFLKGGQFSLIIINLNSPLLRKSAVFNQFVSVTRWKFCSKCMRVTLSISWTVLETCWSNSKSPWDTLTKLAKLVGLFSVS